MDSRCAPVCVRHDEPGTGNKRLREIVLEANRRAAQELSDQLASLYDYDGHLIATWRTTEGRRLHAHALSCAWQARMGDRPVLHLVPSQDDYDFIEDVMDSPPAAAL